MSPLSRLLLESTSLSELEHGLYHKASIWEYKAGDLDCIHLQSIMVKKNAPPGTGTEFMRELIGIANRDNKWITLDLGSRDYGSKYSEYKSTTSSSRLKRWYSSLGFKRNSAKGLYQLRGSMHRPPRGVYPW